MEMSFRWYGKSDSIPLEYIRQIPGMKGIVTAIYDIPVGEAWPLEKIMELKKTVEEHGMRISVIESVPVHEDIKIGLPTRDKYIENYKQRSAILAKQAFPLFAITLCRSLTGPVHNWIINFLTVPRR